LSAMATEAKLGPKYLALVWSVLTEGEATAGPLAAVRVRFGELPAPDRSAPDAARPGCKHLRDLVVRLRRPLQPGVKRLRINGVSAGSQPLVLWHNREQARRHRTYEGEVAADLRKMAEQLK